MQESLATVIRDDINKMLNDSDFISILTDESCDITTTKKLCIYARVVKDCKPKTVFIQNLDIPDGGAETISELQTD